MGCRGAACIMGILHTHKDVPGGPCLLHTFGVQVGTHVTDLGSNIWRLGLRPCAQSKGSELQISQLRRGDYRPRTFLVPPNSGYLGPHRGQEAGLGIQGGSEGVVQ